MQTRTIGVAHRKTARHWPSAIATCALAVLCLAPAASAAPAANAATAASAMPSIRVGGLTLHRCQTGPLVYCGGIKVPLDYSSAASPDIHIGFELLPATGPNPATGTILAVEGGPGFATTGSQSLYVAMAGSLLRTRNMLLVDLRGTGTSTPLDCQGLEDYGNIQHQYGSDFDQLVGACGDQLNHTWHYRHGGWVHASDLFNSADSAHDVATVVRDLRLGKVDLYGDSYGSWFAQVFASRYPQLLRSVTLDSTYQVLDLNPWYTTTVVTARRAFDQACSRWPTCSSAARGPAWALVTRLARRLARSPVTGETSVFGARTRMTVTEETLVNLVNNAGFDPIVYQDLDAAGRALLRHRDPAPLLRLAAQSIGVDDANFPLPEFSDALYFAVSCTDYVQLFSRTAAPAVRLRQYDAALRREPARTFAPFTVAQWTSMDQYTEAYSACLDWPSPVHRVVPITRRPPLVPASVPVLIMSGTFDSLTPRLDGATLVAHQMGKSARLVTFANLTHVTLQDANDSCPASVYQAFVNDPAGLPGQQVSCAAQVAPIHAVGSYPLRLADAVPARPATGNTAGRQALQAATVALDAVGDEISRSPELLAVTDLGLRGGYVTISDGTGTVTFTLHAVRWVTDATIDGTAVWDQAASPGTVTANLTVHPAHGAAVSLTATWTAFAQPDDLAVISGTQGSGTLEATSPAP